MAVLSDYTSGTISLANGSTTVTGTGTLFEVTRFREGDTLQIQNLTAVIASVDSDTQLTLTEPWTGTSIVDGPYRARQLADGTRVGTQAATLIELLGDGTLAGIAALGVEEGKSLVGGPAGQYELVDTSTFGIQDPNGSLGKLAALTLAADKAITTDGSGNAQQSDLGALGRALLALASGTNAQYVRGDGQLAALNKAAVGLGNVDNTSDAAKPISTATQTALNAKANSASPTITGSAMFTGQPSIKTGSYPTQTPALGFGWGNSAVVWRAVLETDGGLGWHYYNISNGDYIGRTIKLGHDGSLNVTGALSKGGGTALFDHPLDPMNKNLRYGFTEGPRYYLVHVGAVQLVNGRATVDLDKEFGTTPGTFVAATQRAFVTGLNHQGSADPVFNSPIDGAVFEITCTNEQADGLVVWTVIAERGDAFVRNLDPNCERGTGQFIPEFEKPDYAEPENV